MDTNIYLSFYSLSSDDLEELKKLMVLLDNKEVMLHLPEQTKTEFYRNRENKISETIKKMRDWDFSVQFPQIAKNYPEYEKMRFLLKDLNINKESLEKSMNADIYNTTLKADDLINQIFSTARFQETTDEILSKSKLRFDIGNPPGKNNSYGDAINWESLIASVDTKKTNKLYFIGIDKDFVSPLDKTKFNFFLQSERKNKKGGEIVFYKNLTDFFSDNFPKIKLATELHKKFALTNFINSGSFYETRVSLRKLQSIDNFTDDEIRDIVEACITNNQIYWMNGDEDIQEMLQNILENRLDAVDEDSIGTFLDIYDKERIEERARIAYEEDEKETRRLLFPKEEIT